MIWYNNFFPVQRYINLKELEMRMCSCTLQLHIKKYTLSICCKMTSSADDFCPDCNISGICQRFTAICNRLYVARWKSISSWSVKQVCKSCFSHPVRALWATCNDGTMIRNLPLVINGSSLLDVTPSSKSYQGIQSQLTANVWLVLMLMALNLAQVRC